jgi:hypothetical protein
MSLLRRGTADMTPGDRLAWKLEVEEYLRQVGSRED